MQNCCFVGYGKILLDCQRITESGVENQLAKMCFLSKRERHAKITRVVCAARVSYARL
jgi:hypothetical protein